MTQRIIEKNLCLVNRHGKVHTCDELTSNQVTSVISLRRQVIGTLDRHNRTSVQLQDAGVWTPLFCGIHGTYLCK